MSEHVNTLDNSISVAGSAEVVVVGNVGSEDDSDSSTDNPDSDTAEKVETIDSPAKVMRIGTMLKRLLKQARSLDLDEESRQRLRDIYEVSLVEIGSVLSPDLCDELSRLTSPFQQSEPPSAVELQIAKAQLVGWLEGLIRGMQAMLFAQEMAARRQIEAMRTELLPVGKLPFGSSDEASKDHTEDHPGAYL